MTRLLLVAAVILATTGVAASSGPPRTLGGDTVAAPVPVPGASPAPVSQAPTTYYKPYARCRIERGYRPATRTPSLRELNACRKQRAYDAERDAYVAIRMVFPQSSWKDAMCIVDGEGGRWNRVAPVGRAGEITSWQWHPLHWSGSGAWLDPVRLRSSALYATRAAHRLWKAKGWQPWWISSGRCGAR